METTPSSDRPLVILNPTANRGQMKKHRTLVHQQVEQTGAEYRETIKRGDARAWAHQAALDGRPLIIVGGDGSVHEVVNGILGAGRQVPLGIVAAGSGNDFAWNTLLLPRDPTAAVERAFNGHTIEVDGGIVNGEYFANSFSIGLDADIAVAAHSMKKFPLMSGTRLYYSATLKQLLFGYHRCPWVRFRMDSGEASNEADFQHVVLIAVTNGPTYGAGFRINPQAERADGLLDICVIKHAPLSRAMRLLPVVQKGQHTGQPEVTFYRSRTVHIESRAPVNIQMDGETSCTSTYEAEILPGALLVRV